VETCYVRGVGGQVIAEYGTDGLLKKWNLGSFGYKIKRSGSTPESFYFLKDHIGNIRVTVNEAGDIVTKDDYYPFGLRMAGFSYNHGAPESHLKFSGKELDEEQGLKKYHFGWRDYDPELGRWNAVDPLRQFASPYVAMGNYPVGYYDEDGRFVPLLIAMGVGAAMNSMMNADKIDNWGDFFTYAGIGAGIGALGYGAALFAPAGILGGAAYGAGTGAITGGLSTWANNDFSGGIFNRGMLSGAITGGIGGGIAGYQKADAMGMDVWTGEYRPVEMEPVTLLEAPTINNKPTAELSPIPKDSQKIVNEMGLDVQEDWVIDKMKNSPGLGNGNYLQSDGYGMGPTSKYPNPRNDCSLRIARATGVSDALHTGNVSNYYGQPVSHNSSRLQVVVWRNQYIQHMGLTKDNILIHMQKSGFQNNKSLSIFSNWALRSKKASAAFYNLR
jgi:RHS repeat-associated protein